MEKEMVLENGFSLEYLELTSCGALHHEAIEQIAVQNEVSYAVAQSLCEFHFLNFKEFSHGYPNPRQVGRPQG